jgi:hypothetical protein
MHNTHDREREAIACFYFPDLSPSLPMRKNQRLAQLLLKWFLTHQSPFIPPVFPHHPEAAAQAGLR